MEYVIKNARIVLEDNIFNGDLLIEDGKIKKIGNNLKFTNVINAENKYVIPGFIDIHIHGARGYDVMDANEESLVEIAKFLLSKGITSFFPTILTHSKNKMLEALKNIQYVKDKKIKMSNILGTHIEGPYFNHEYKGAQNPEFIREGNLEELREFIKCFPNLVKLFSLAPEKNSQDLIRFLREKNVIVSMGHTGASFEKILESINNGLSHATHTFNGMRGLHHREPGALGAVMLSDCIYAELILDKIHVHIECARLLLKTKGIDKLILVSDCISAGGMPDGNYFLGGLDVVVSNGIARTLNGSLAGSTLTLDLAFKNAINDLSISIIEAVKISSTNVAKEFSINNKGIIKEGYDADLLFLNEDYTINKIILNGEFV